MTVLQNLDKVDINNSQLGFYRAGDKKFVRKYDALLYATKNNLDVTYHWYDEVFDNFDRSRLGAKKLEEMYIERAKELRANYDYLILNYSGGTDSWNILKVFLDNNIKVDHIMVSWPISATNSKYYVPNDKDVSARNFMSEWDFTMKPDIDWLQREYPQIKMELIDWAKPFFEDPDFVKPELFDQLNHFHNMADLARSTLFSQTEKDLCEQGVRVCTIWGIDKPSVFIDRSTNVCSMKFMDSIITVGHPPVWNPLGTEYFYWSPNMPSMAFEMAYQTIQWFKSRPSFQKFMWNVDPSKNFANYLTIMQMNQVATRDTCYASWASKPTKFQVNKPLKPAREDKDFWMYENEELAHHVTRWRAIYDQHLNAIDEKFLVVDAEGKRLGYKAIPTKLHQICQF